MRLVVLGQIYFPNSEHAVKALDFVINYLIETM